MCILSTPRPIYRSTYRPTLDRCIGRHIGRVSVDMSTDISVESRSIYRRDVSVDISTDVYRPSDGRHIDRDICQYSGRHSADTSTIDCRQSIGRLSVVYRSSES